MIITCKHKSDITCKLKTKKNNKSYIQSKCSVCSQTGKGDSIEEATTNLRLTPKSFDTSIITVHYNSGNTLERIELTK